MLSAGLYQAGNHLTISTLVDEEPLTLDFGCIEKSASIPHGLIVCLIVNNCKEQI